MFTKTLKERNHHDTLSLISVLGHEKDHERFYVTALRREVPFHFLIQSGTPNSSRPSRPGACRGLPTRPTLVRTFTPYDVRE
ncbi:hypothetical protein EVAR_22697_1 [Eumeta japonica]|uniref:Uncharacterized protein n=1 Tax=Eumeta variegata TaxID=151549 RepID=A0A4C1UTK9_EUMVA|nr:hypothetical protein EVAR_22697_1 [Eumeta japonica]